VGTLILETQGTRRHGDTATRRHGDTATNAGNHFPRRIPASPCRRVVGPGYTWLLDTFLAATQEHGTNFRVGEQRLPSVFVAVLPHGQDIPTVCPLQRLARVLLYYE